MNPIAGKTNVQNLQAATANWKNQLNGHCHDAAGNLLQTTSCPSQPTNPTYVYDAENRLVGTAGFTYVYDGDGRRIKKCSACSTGSGGTLYWTGMGTDNLVESNLAGTLTFEYIFFNGKRVARRNGTTNPPNYYFADYLGSMSVVTSSAGAIQDDSDYFPYGGEIPYLNNLPQNYKFTGKERDSESGLDNFGARYDASSMGRFMTPDPVFFQADMLTDPQRFNQYAYVRNSPLTLVDPRGESIELTGDEEERKKQLQALQQAVGAQAGSYLYQNAVTTTDANGNKTTNYYVGVYTNGPSGQGPAFGSINSASGALGNIISDSRVAELNLVPAGTTVTNNQGEAAQIGPIGNGSPGATYTGQDGKLHVTLLDTSTTSPGQLPADYMSNGQPGVVDAGILAGHEFGHVRYEWGGFWRQALDSSNSSAVRLENDVRKLRDPNAATRTQH